MLIFNCVNNYCNLYNIFQESNILQMILIFTATLINKI
jgi:hypothetical protein